MWRLRSRRRRSLAAGQVWHCEDPRRWSGGSGGRHYVVLLADERDGNWRAAVIETSPPNAIIEIDEPRIGVHGGIRLPTAVLRESDLGTLKGNLGSVRAALYDEELANAELELRPPAQPEATTHAGPPAANALGKPESETAE